jgi:hypothetical protein
MWTGRNSLRVQEKQESKQWGKEQFVMCPKWDPCAPNVRDGLKLMEEALYFNKENEKVFPRASIIAGFRRQKNVGEMIAPTKPKMLPTVVGEKGCQPFWSSTQREHGRKTTGCAIWGLCLLG